MKSFQEKVFDYIKDNPDTTYEDIENDLKMKSDAKVYVHRLKKKGLLEGDVKTGFKITGDYNPTKSSKYQDVYYEMIEYYLEDFREAGSFNERIMIGKEIRLLIEQVK